MSNYYHDPSDLTGLKEMGKLAPVEFKAWANLDGIVAREDGKIPRKYRADRFGSSSHDAMRVLH